MVKRNLLLTVLLVGSLFLAAPASAKVIKWKLGHSRSPENSIHAEMLDFAERVKKGTNGQLEITVMGGGQLGNWTVAQERVAMGNFAMTVVPFATAVDKRMEIATLPTLVSDWENAKKNFVKGSPFVDLVSKWAMEQNLEILSTHPSYFGGIGFSKEIENPSDPTLDRGFKIRIPEQVTFRLLAESLGYIPTPIPMTDLFPALQTGVVEGVAGAGAEPLFSSGYAEILKSYLPANTHFEIWWLVVNPEMMAKLPKDVQEVVRREAIVTQNKRYEIAPGAEKHWEGEFVKKGVKVYELTDEQIAAYQKIMRDATWGEIRKTVGAEVFDNATKLLMK